MNLKSRNLILMTLFHGYLSPIYSTILKFINYCPNIIFNYSDKQQNRRHMFIHKTINNILLKPHIQIIKKTILNIATQKDKPSSPIINRRLNSIMPQKYQGYAYGHYFPKQWTQEEIKRILDPSQKNIQKLNIIKTSIGESSGKILIKFKNQQIRTKYIQKYNQDFLITQPQVNKIVILPFQLRTQQQKKQQKANVNLKYGVRISNLDFDTNQLELRKLSSDFGTVTYIDMNLRQSGINKGFANVYFSKKKQSVDFIQFIDGFVYKENKLKAHQIQNIQYIIQKQLLEVPIITFKANLELMSKMKARKFQNVSEN